MAVLKSEVKRLTISVPKKFVSELDAHLSNFALTDRSKWIIEASKEKLAKEKELLSEIKTDD